MSDKVREPAYEGAAVAERIESGWASGRRVTT
ncbi:hypothetical protein X011_13470 [Mycobacterium tuberculosis variant microti OV254]|nr:hypothetical protein X011_13470 [Mycobacterium tuberculosis variant microti OV254]